MARWSGLNVLAVEQFDDEMLRELFEATALMKQMVQQRGKSDLLRGKILANVFFEPSTRTMCSFDAAMKRLGGDVISVSESGSSAKKGETIEDTVRCLQCYCDVLVLRHPEKGTAARAGAAASKPLLNAGDGTGEHPTQALLDLFTIASARKAEAKQMTNLAGVTLTLLGDLKHGRTVHSLALLAARLAAPPTLQLVSPPALKMPDSVLEQLAAKGLKVQESEQLAPALGSSDVLYVTRVQKERFPTEAEYLAVKGSYVIDPQLMSSAPKGMVVMHPLPRVDEISPEVDTDPRAIYFEQMENGMYVRMALLALVLGADMSQL